MSILQERLHMNLKESDVVERVTVYFGCFTKIINENGLTKLLDKPEREKFKVTCLVKFLQPAELKAAVKERLEIRDQSALKDASLLYDVVLEEALKVESAWKKAKKSIAPKLTSKQVDSHDSDVDESDSAKGRDVGQSRSTRVKRTRLKKSLLTS